MVRGSLSTAVCQFLSTLNCGQVIAVSEGINIIGVPFVSVYYREE
jgi:hypothetical protein